MLPHMELCCGTVRQAALPQLIEVAAATGFGSITINPDMIAESGLDEAALRARLRDAGIAVTNVDGFGSGLPGLPEGEALAAYRGYHGRDVTRTFTTLEEDFYRAAEAVGCDSINLMHFGGDPATPLAALADALGAIARRAEARGLRIVLEFLPRTAISSIDVAAALIEAVGAPNMGIMLDTRHLARTGGAPADVARHARLVGGVQVSDLFVSTMEDPDRLQPGEGDLPLEEMVGPVLAASPELPIGIELFNAAMFAMPALQAAEQSAAALRALLKRSATSAVA